MLPPPNRCFSAALSLPLAQSVHAAQFNGLAHACFLRRSLCAHAWPRSLTSLRAQGFLVAAAASANSAINRQWGLGVACTQVGTGQDRAGRVGCRCRTC